MRGLLLRFSAIALPLAAAGCPSLPQAPVAPPSAACPADAGPSGTFCLSGTVTAAAFTAPIQEVAANLYSLFPSGAATAYATQTVAKDGTWAFSGLPVGPHYYVQISMFFQQMAEPVSRIVGPFTADPSATPVQVPMKPIELDVLESRVSEPMADSGVVVADGGVATGGLAIRSARAHVFDPSSGSEILGTASVAITVGGVTLPMPWDSGELAYFLELSTPLLAQANYTVTTSDPSLDAGTASWLLIADPPLFDGEITLPVTGSGSVPVGQPLVVTWTPEPADYVSLELFENEGAGDAASWQITYPSPGAPPPGAPPLTLAPDAGTTSIPGSSLATAGAYLLNLAYSKSNCPVTADGCVSAAAIAAATFNVSDSTMDAGSDGSP
jgi:hypothetical protein